MGDRPARPSLGSPRSAAAGGGASPNAEPLREAGGPGEYVALSMGAKQRYPGRTLAVYNAESLRGVAGPHRAPVNGRNGGALVLLDPASTDVVGSYDLLWYDCKQGSITWEAPPSVRMQIYPSSRIIRRTPTAVEFAAHGSLGGPDVYTIRFTCEEEAEACHREVAARCRIMNMSLRVSRGSKMTQELTQEVRELQAGGIWWWLRTIVVLVGLAVLGRWAFIAHWGQSQEPLQTAVGDVISASVYAGQWAARYVCSTVLGAGTCLPAAEIQKCLAHPDVDGVRTCMEALRAAADAQITQELQPFVQRVAAAGLMR